MSVMDEQIFRSWQPDKCIPERVEIISVCDEEEGLVISLAEEESRKPVAKLVFQDFVAYRNINESFRMRTWGSWRSGKGTSLIEVKSSLWLHWLGEESGGVLEEFEVTHYAIYTNDDCLDVASRTPPVVLRS